MSASQARGFETRPDLVADGFKLELFSGITYSTVQSKSSVSCFVFEKKFFRSLLGSRTCGCDGSPIGLSRVTEKNPNWLGPVSRCVGKVCCIFRPAFGSLSAFKLWIKYSTSVLVQTLKKHYFAKFCTKFVAFLPFQLFQLLCTKNAENDYFGQHLGCAAPKRCTYTNLDIHIILLNFVQATFSIVKYFENQNKRLKAH